jgi:hypothetical protein
MTTLNPDQLLTLAHAYSETTGVTLGTVGKRACGGNHHFFNRLAKGRGANALSIMRAVEWFVVNWPDNAAWPKGIPGKPSFRARSPGKNPIWNDQAFKRWVRDGAKARGVPLYKVLEAAGLNKFYLNETSKGRSTDAVLKLADVLEISPAPLFGFSTDAEGWHEERKRMPKLLPVEESNILELSSVDDQPGKLRLRLRIDRVIDWRLAIQIIRMIGDAENGTVNAPGTFAKSVLANDGKQGPE